jgi:hypothetical protein
LRLRRHLTYANVMATIAVFGVLAGGSAYAVSKIDTPDIANKAVTAKKLDTESVKTSKLRTGAVTSDKLAGGAVETRNLSKSATLAFAGATVANGEVRGWFNRLSETQPTLDHPQPGVYELFIPGMEEQQANFVRLLSSASLIGTNVAPHGEISTRWDDPNRSGTPHAIVNTFDSNGNPVDAAFTFVVYLADQGL